MSEKKPFEIQPYTGKQLAVYYGVSYRVFRAWIKEIKEELGPQVGKIWNIKQVKIIIKHLDAPTHG